MRVSGLRGVHARAGERAASAHRAAVRARAQARGGRTQGQRARWVPSARRPHQPPQRLRPVAVTLDHATTTPQARRARGSGRTSERRQPSCASRHKHTSARAAAMVCSCSGWEAVPRAGLLGVCWVCI
eukprot:1149744-Prymnesium_polylepis.1